jgi:hypothetical protein
MSDTEYARADHSPDEVIEPEPMLNPWRVLKRDEKADSAFVGAVWVELATLSGKYTYTSPDVDEIGALGGAGEYLLIGEHTTKTVEIEAFTRYQQVESGVEQ